MDRRNYKSSLPGAGPQRASRRPWGSSRNPTAAGWSPGVARKSLPTSAQLSTRL